MTRRIDPVQRNTDIAAAALRVLERDGLAAVSVRGVAEEAQLATASLRRAFPTQFALRAFCLDLIRDRVTARIRALPSTGRRRAVDMLLELLPLDPERRTEIVAQTQLGLLALTDPQLVPASEALDTAVGGAAAAAIELLTADGMFSPSRSREFEADRLHALLDGLAMRGVWASGALSADTAAAIVEAHLGELASPAGNSIPAPDFRSDSE